MSDTPNIALAQSALAGRSVDAPSASGKTQTELHEAAKQFEAVFINEMFSYMTEGLPTDGPIGGGNGEAMMRSMLNDEYAKSLAARGGVGISDSVYRELLAYQEGSSNGPGTNSTKGQ